MIKGILWLKDNFAAVWRGIKTAFSTIAKTIKKAYNSGFGWLLPGGAFIKAILWVKNNWSKVWNAILNPFSTAFRGIRNALKLFRTALKLTRQAGKLTRKILVGAFKGLAKILKAPVNAAISAVNGMINTLSGKVLFDVPEKKILNQTVFPGWKLTLPTIPSIPMLAAGGIIKQSGMAIVGERGPELVSLPAGAIVHPNNTYNYNITENYARPEQPQQIGYTLAALAALART